MAASYPSSLPTKTAAGANLSTNPHSTLHDAMYDEIVALATELGTSPKGTFATVKARLADLTPTTATYTPSLTASTTNPTLGASSVVQGRYITHGGICTVWVRIQFGTSGVSTGTGVYLVSLPVAAAATILPSTSSGGGTAVGSAHFRDDSATSNNEAMTVQLYSTTLVQFIHGAGAVQHNSPITWAVNDVLTFTATYPV